MNNSLLQLLVLAGIAVFLILKLRSVLGTREGFEKPPVPVDDARATPVRRSFDVIEGGPDRDITDHVAEGSAAAKALAAMKQAEPSFALTGFLSLFFFSSFSSPLVFFLSTDPPLSAEW